MARVLRFLTLVVSFAALQLTLASGGPGCPMPGAASAMRGVDMAGMDVSAMEMGGPPMASSGRAANEASPATDTAPCDESTAPVTCPTMAPCVFAALPPLPQVAATAAVAAPSAPAALRVLMPPSVRAAPELPPPRV